MTTTPLLLLLPFTPIILRLTATVWLSCGVSHFLEFSGVLRAVERHLVEPRDRSRLVAVLHTACTARLFAPHTDNSGKGPMSFF
jgi:hypothetical protein